MKFRKKPVVIDAVRVSQTLENAQNNWGGLPPWIVEAYNAGNLIFTPAGVLITTLEGKMQADPGDWIIRGVKGEIYPCKPDIFAATYDRVEDDARLPLHENPL